VMSLWVPSHFLFPLGLTYLAFGVGRAILFGFLDRGDWHPAVVESESDLPRAPRFTAPRRVDDRTTRGDDT